jgi:hypothetical protein
MSLLQLHSNPLAVQEDAQDVAFRNLTIMNMDSMKLALRQAETIDRQSKTIDKMATALTGGKTHQAKKPNKAKQPNKDKANKPCPSLKKGEPCNKPGKCPYKHDPEAEDLS